MINAILDDIIAGVKASPQDTLRLKHFLVFVVFGIPTMAVYGLYNYFNGQVNLALAISLCAAALVAGAVIQVRNPSGSAVFRVCALFYSSLLLYVFVLGGDGGSKSLWLFTFPLIGFFLLGKREGAVWSAMLIIIVVLIHYLPYEVVQVYDYSEEFFIRIVSVYVIICCVSAWFEHFRTTYFEMNQLGNQKFLEIIENSRDILYRRDFQEGEYAYISDSFNRELGYSPEETRELVFQGVELLIHPDDRPAHRKYLDNLVKGSLEDDSAYIEYRMRHKNGNYLWFSDKATVMYDSDGKPDHMIGINREITQFRQIRLALENSQEQLLTILNSIDAHVYVADMENHEILFMNERMAKDFEGNLEGELCWKKFCKLDGPCDFCTNHKLLDNKYQPTGVYEWENFNPTVNRWYRNYDRAIQWINGKWVKLQIAIDITRNKEMEEERKKAEEMARRTKQLEAIGSLAGGIAHDFNNILQVINGNAELVKEEGGISDSAYDCLREINLASAKARELANRLISFSPGGKLLSDPVDTASFLEELVLLNSHTGQIQLNLEIEPEIWSFLANKRQLMTAFSNLLTNSIESLGEDGVLEITASNCLGGEQKNQEELMLPAHEFVKIMMVDNGCGIEPQNLSRIFDPYFSTKKMSAVKGVGLGLPIAYSIIKRSNGELHIDSTVGKGTAVSVYLPAAL
jgi:PAS domain S-box-containing protein